MLGELHVRNIGGIRAASLSFRPGLIAVTGESGAGKSSLVRAIEAVCGRRYQAAFVGTDGDDAEVSVLLEKVPPLFEDIPPEDGTFVVRRVLAAGRGRAFVQGRPVPLATLVAGMGTAVSIQSQFAQLDLLEPERQLDLVDARGGEDLRTARERLGAAFSEALVLERTLAAMRQRRRDIEGSSAHLEDVRDSIRRLDPFPGMEESLKEEGRSIDERIAHASRLAVLRSLLSGNASEEGLVRGVERLCLDLARFEDERSSLWRASADRALAELEAVRAAVAMVLAEDDPKILELERERIEERTGTLRRLKRALGVATVEEMLEKWHRVNEDLAWFVRSREELAEATDHGTALRAEVRSAALTLRAARSTASRELEERVNAILADLAMPGDPFAVVVSPLERVRKEGAEEVGFFLTDGEMRRPVAKAASGGELSRILLALTVALPDERLPGTLVFDEVEAGLGGTAALLAGRKLKDLSRRTQVLLVTHEATIAALADQHFVVMRDGNRTCVEEVSGRFRVVEIARMLAGDASSPEALSHAARLLGEADPGAF